jgi:CDP-glucose 4,6-dehydratase
MAVTPAFWRGKRVLVTGHTGFKGSWLSLWLQSLGAHVSGFALASPTQPNLFEVARVKEGMTHASGDVRDIDAVCEAFSRAEPEVVFHMAAQSLVRYSYAHPVETYATNVLGTVHVLEAVRRIGNVRVVVNVTSDKCYENREWLWGYREFEPMGGKDPYSSSKGCAELITAAYRASFFAGYAAAAVATARAGNVIGGGDWARDRLVPDIMRAVETGRPAVLRNPDAVRPWQHVLEAVHGYLCLAERLWKDGPAFAEPWNFGPYEEDVRPVSWVADYLTGKWGEGACCTTDPGAQPHEASYLKLDSGKARARLGWRPVFTLAEALDRIIEWHRALRDGKDMRHFTALQIQEYALRLA